MAVNEVRPYNRLKKIYVNLPAFSYGVKLDIKTAKKNIVETFLYS